MNQEKIITYVMIGAIVALVGVLAWSILKPDYYGANYQKAKVAELPDKCKTPPGYTDAEWREHMGHHPDQYKECF